MLGSQIDLHICTAVVIGPAAGRLLAVFRVPGLLLSVFYDGKHRCRLRRLADLPAVMTSGDGHIFAVRRFQSLRFIGRIILSCQFFYISGCLAFVQGDVSSVHCDPLADGIAVQHFPGIPEGMGHHSAHIPVHLCRGCGERLVCFIHRRLRIAAFRVQVHLLRKTGNGRSHRPFHLLLHQLGSQDRRQHRIAFCAAAVLGDPGIFRLLHLLRIHKREFPELLLQPVSVKGDHGADFMIRPVLQIPEPLSRLLLLQELFQAAVEF